MPGTIADCYTGPPGTENKGNCHPGKKTCAQDGTYGPCNGEVTPTPEVCTTVGDENCDGVACSDTLWAFNAGDSNDQHVAQLAVDATGNIFVTGDFQGTLTLLNKPKGTSVLLNANGIGAFVAKLTAAGDVLWGSAFSTGNNVYPTGLAVDANGDVVVAGSYAGTLSFPPLAATTSTGAISSGFVAKLNGATGQGIWSTSFNSGAGSSSADMASVAANGDVIVGGGYSSDLNVGGVPLTATKQRDVWIARLKANTGDTVWANDFGAAGCASGGVLYLDGLALDGKDNAFFQADFTGDVKAGVCHTVIGKANTANLVMFEIDGSGKAVWSSVIAPNDPMGTYSPGGFALDSSANLLLAGVSSSGLDFGKGLTGMGGNFVTKFFSGSANYTLVEFPTQSKGGLARFSTDKSDNMFVVGNVSSSMNYGGGALPFNGINDAVLVKFDKNLAHLWSKSFGTTGYTFATTVVWNPAANEVLIAGSTDGTADFGLGPLSSNGNYDIFIAAFQP